MSDILQARDVRKTVRDAGKDLHILGGVSLSLKAGERLALVGPSGSGKSSLLNILGAIDPEFEGDVQILDRSLRGMSDREAAAFRNNTLGFVFQSFNLLKHLTALENVLLPAAFGDLNITPQTAQSALEKVGLGDKGHRLPTHLSGGERQRVAIARAVVHHPQLILCDEPTGSLDKKTGADVLKIFDRLRDDGVAMIMATHNEQVAATADCSLEIVDGVLT